MELKELIFLFLALLTVISGFLVVSLKNILHAAFSLLVTFFGVGGLFVYLGADFLAATQILIYIGGIMILVLFAIMLSEKVYNLSFFHRSKILPGILVFGGFLFILIRVISVSPWKMRPDPPGALVPTTETLGRLLLNEYLLPFEVISMLLLAALLGAVIIIRKEVGRRGRLGKQ